MKKGWYILNYHDVSWEENDFTRSIGGTFPPDVFESHLNAINKLGKLVSIQEGFNNWKNNTINEPMFSIWFDDGFKGVRKYALPILKNFNISAGISINSSFISRSNMFWRFKLSFINNNDSSRILRSRFKKFGYIRGKSLKDFVLNNFDIKLVNEIDTLFNEITSNEFRNDAFRLFDSVKGINNLVNEGWILSNHTNNHYPVGEDSAINLIKDEFNVCQKFLIDEFNIDSKFMVLPFDRQLFRSKSLFKNFKNIFNENKYLVLVGNKYNDKYSGDNIIHRIAVNDFTSQELKTHLLFL
jgi:peptidoglycan/xylan/chitin deacetylase (PgdA/CDA1 family)